jgi:ribonuclease P protein component
MKQAPVIKQPCSGTMRFSRQSRLLKPAEFKQVFKQPIRSSDHCFRILARSNESQCHRLGLAVAKKACPKAVGRNRIKRIVRESFRTRVAGQADTLTLDFVVLPSANAANETNQVLSESLNKQWQKLIEKASRAQSVSVANRP